MYEQQVLRCAACQETFAAALPETATGRKYDPSVGAAVAVARFGLGLSHTRLEQWLRLRSNSAVTQARRKDTTWSLLTRLATSVPPPRFHTVRYSGVLAGASRWRPDITPQAPQAPRGAPRGGGRATATARGRSCWPARSSDVRSMRVFVDPA